MSEEKQKIADRLPVGYRTSLPVSETKTAAQERFTDAQMAEIKRGFAQRLRIAFDEANNAEIARRCRTTDTTIKLYTDGERLPIPEMLLQITRVTGVNLHWLLTGEGTRRKDFGNLFTEEEERLISGMAKKRGMTFDELVARLTMSGVEFLESLD